MENVSNISSEEELLGLRNNGKISEAEYQDLLAAMRKSRPQEDATSVPETIASESKRKRGTIALALMVTGLVLPAVCLLVLQMLAPEGSGPTIAPWFFLGVAMEVAALVMGALAWPDELGKATVITTGIVAALTLLVLFLTLS